jgi:3-hydroxymyristoyl/3-hydroxydecanoyl-(acyl carrier protein) dehydratase
MLAITFAADHPAARGHFPGNPIIPGALLLSEALRAVAAALEIDLSRCSVSSAKFPSPSRPGDRIEIAFARSGCAISLGCTVAGRTVLKAQVACEPAKGSDATLVKEPRPTPAKGSRAPQ